MEQKLVTRLDLPEIKTALDQYIRHSGGAPGGAVDKFEFEFRDAGNEDDDPLDVDSVDVTMVLGNKPAPLAEQAYTVLVVDQPATGRRTLAGSSPELILDALRREPLPFTIRAMSTVRAYDPKEACEKFNADYKPAS